MKEEKISTPKNVRLALYCKPREGSYTSRILEVFFCVVSILYIISVMTLSSKG